MNAFDELAESLITLREAAEKLRDSAREMRERTQDKQQAKRQNKKVGKTIKIKPAPIYLYTNGSTRKN